MVVEKSWLHLEIQKKKNWLRARRIFSQGVQSKCRVMVSLICVHLDWPPERCRITADSSDFWGWGWMHSTFKCERLLSTGCSKVKWLICSEIYEFSFQMFHSIGKLDWFPVTILRLILFIPFFSLVLVRKTGWRVVPTLQPRLVFLDLLTLHPLLLLLLLLRMLWSALAQHVSC